MGCVTKSLSDLGQSLPLIYGWCHLRSHLHIYGKIQRAQGVTGFQKKRTRLHGATSSPKDPRTSPHQLPGNDYDTEISRVDDVTTTVAPVAGGDLRWLERQGSEARGENGST